MKRIYIIHGWEGSSKNDFVPWTKVELEKLGFQVIAPDMPNTDEPKIDEWVNHLKSIALNPDENTYFIGHSIGSQTVMRYMESLSDDVKIGGCIYIAGWFKLSNLGEEESEVARPWEETPINLEKIKNIPQKTIAFFSTNDEWVPFEENVKEFKEKLNAEIIIVENAGHMTGDDGFTEFPKLIEIVKANFS